MRGLTIVVAGPDRSRFRTALTLAAAQAALGARARLFLEVDAVALVRRNEQGEQPLVAAGLPTTAELIDTGLALGVAITLCQSGIALAGLNLAELDQRLEAGGITSILATLGDDRLLAI